MQLSHEKEKRLNLPSCVGVGVVLVKEVEQVEANSTFSTPSIAWKAITLSSTANYLALDVGGDVRIVCTLSKLFAVLDKCKHGATVDKQILTPHLNRSLVLTRGQEFQSSSQVVTRWYQPIIVV